MAENGTSGTAAKGGVVERKGARLTQLGIADPAEPSGLTAIFDVRVRGVEFVGEVEEVGANGQKTKRPEKAVVTVSWDGGKHKVRVGAAHPLAQVPAGSRAVFTIPMDQTVQAGSGEDGAFGWMGVKLMRVEPTLIDAAW